MPYILLKSSVTGKFRFCLVVYLRKKNSETVQ